MAEDHIQEEDVPKLIEFINQNVAAGAWSVIAPCGCVVLVHDAMQLAQLAATYMLTGTIHPAEDSMDEQANAPTSNHTH